MSQPGVRLETETSNATRLIIRQIISGQLVPGQRIKIRELSSQTGIGPTTMREGVARLVGCGFVLSFDQRGYRVSELSSADLATILLLKEALERAFSREAVARADASWRMDVLGMVDRLERLEAEPAITGFPWDMYEADKAFHMALLSRGRSSLGIRIWSVLHDQCVRYMVATTLGGSVEHFTRRAQDIDEHRKLAEAFIAGDAVDALETLLKHNRKDMEGIA